MSEYFMPVAWDLPDADPLADLAFAWGRDKQGRRICQRCKVPLQAGDVIEPVPNHYLGPTHRHFICPEVIDGQVIDTAPKELTDGR